MTLNHFIKSQGVEDKKIMKIYLFIYFFRGESYLVQLYEGSVMMKELNVKREFMRMRNDESGKQRNERKNICSKKSSYFFMFYGKKGTIQKFVNQVLAILFCS